MTNEEVWPQKYKRHKKEEFLLDPKQELGIEAK
jgi:hypothetical protein